MFNRLRHTMRVLAKSDDTLEKARDEVRHKSDGEIDQETALKWAARAVAAFEMAEEQKHSLRQRIEYFSMGDDFRHEAREHAATASDNVKTLHEVESQIDRARESALNSFGGESS